MSWVDGRFGRMAGALTGRLVADKEIHDAEVHDLDDADDFAVGHDDRIKPVEKLSDRDQRILAFERKWWRHAGSKEQAIREHFELSATRYYQVLNRLLDLPEALEFDAVTVGRLRRLRATRARARSSR
jgi:hypothetical protein